MRTPIRSAGALALLILAAGCGTEGDAHEASAAVAALPAEAKAPAQVVEVTAGDFYFRMPARIPSGLTTFRLKNLGPDMHHVQLIRLDEGHDMNELMQIVRGGGKLPAWAREVGGPNVPVPGEQAETTVDLEPGSYAVVCWIPAPDGVPHVMKGMAVPLEVTEDLRPLAGDLASDVRMVLSDYAFEVGEIRAGQRTIRVENAAEQPHEVVFVRLAPGKTAQDMMRWAEKMDSPPPGHPIGGTTGLAKGEVNYVTADFAPGEYALLCFVSDAGDGRPHIAHGMVRQITVR